MVDQAQGDQPPGKPPDAKPDAPIADLQSEGVFRGLILLVFVGSCFLFWHMYTSGGPPQASAPASPQSTNVAPNPELTPEVLQTIDAVELCGDYFANGLAGDQKYKDKRFLITGNVQEVRRNTIDNTYFVDISGGAGNQLVRCYLRDEAEISKAAALVKDAKVQVAGTVAEGDTDTMHAFVTVQDAVIKVP